MSIYDEIKERLSMKDVVEMYGYEPSRSGFISCPFHQEDTASLKIYDKSFYCYGCGAGGDLIKFVARLFNLTNSQAAIRLDYDFRLNLVNQKPDNKQVEELRRKKAEKQRELNNYRTDYLNKCTEFRKLTKILESSKDPVEIAKAQARIDYLDYYFNENVWR